ncbi:hypothetical protein Ahy_A08g038014 [Arachis hypogaea]|uniref:SWIM-type domain-containing protein n=1 Tax=Arachis hypogaea TaxID=3818 RepID=A0A445BSE3_ARAHY|nr:hypothetical protein Ahy_A08g038014 [Arachis hypogaea]
MDDFSVRVHHRGRFCSDKGKTEYVDGEVTTVDWCDRDRWSVIEAYDVVGKLGYIAENIGKLWYKDTELRLEGLKLLKGDEEAMEMANIGVEKKVVDLYVVHKASIPDDFCYDIGYLDVGGDSKVVEEECVDADSGPSDNRQAQNIEVEAQCEGVDMEAQMQGLVDVHLNAEEVLQNVGDGDNSEEEDDSDDPDYKADSDLHFSDSEDDYCGDDGLFDVDITLGEMHQDIRKSKKSKSVVEKLKKTQKVAVGKRKSSRLSDDEGLNSDELEEVSSEDDEASKKKFPVHKELKDMSKYKWEAGTLYATREEFKEAVTSYAVHTGRNIKFPVVDNVRVRAKCGDGCEWFAYAVKMANEDSWQLRTVNDHHSCNTVFDIKVMKSKWLAKVFRRKVEENPKLKLGTIQSRTLRKWNVQISRAKAFRAKQIALVDINGTFREQVLIEKYKDDILPRIKLKLQKEIDASRWWFPVAAGISKFEVIRGRDKFVVDLLKKECTCRKFQMTGLPCPHAVSAINCAKDDIRKYVASCYTKAAYVACYTPMINPCNGHTMWERTTHPDVMPPPHRVPIGRPKKKRARGEGEEPQGPSTSRLGLQQKCSRCLKLGHNKRGCPLRRPTETTAATSSAQNNNAGTATSSPSQHSTAKKAGSTGSAHKRTRLANVAARPNTQPTAQKKFQPPRPTRILRSNSTSTAHGQPSSQGSQTQSTLTGS